MAYTQPAYHSPTGIDYNHPLLGGGFGGNHKVIGGYDFVGDNYTRTTPEVPDPDPLEQCFGHGTHVAGIIGANPGNEFNITGVAYEASLSSYRVFGCSEDGSDDAIVKALLRGVEDNQDILTLSLGEPGGWTTSTASIVASRIAATGKIVVVAAGNQRTSGPWYASSPADGLNVISVASVESNTVPFQTALVHGVQHNPIVYASFFPLHVNGSLPIFATSNDTSVINDACNPLPDHTPDLSSSVVVVRRGNCTLKDKLDNIAIKGGKVALVYDNGHGFEHVDFANYTAALIQAADGEFLVQTFAAGVPVNLTFPQTGGLVNFADPMGGLISSFSSYGPSFDLFLKPAVAAPGGDILSTVPLHLGGLDIQSGTSMAAPSVAGCAALLVQANRMMNNSLLSDARTLFETTGRPVLSNYTNGASLQTAASQGAGLINVYNAVHYKTIVTPGELLLNDTTHFQRNHTITIRNTGSSLQTYNVSHAPAGTVNTIHSTNSSAIAGPVPLNDRSASVELDQTSFTLPPGGMTTLLATFTPPTDVDRTTFPVYSGFIMIKSNTESLHVTYLGLAASIKDKQIIDNSDTYFGFPIPTIVDVAGNVTKGALNYTFADTSIPSLLFRLVFGTPKLHLDLVDVDIKLKPTLNPAGFADHLPIVSFEGVPTVGSIFNLNWTARSSDAPDNQNTGICIQMDKPIFENGTSIPNGSYRFLLRALRVTGNASNPMDVESWLGPPMLFNKSESLQPGNQSHLPV
ncbi:hypothetical protein AMATHDRAFT_83673 [Amanita thiersii Skay4041]|uniref:Peptidase S8/S53 domain-containing protein n=1 Tax=Amanita thiersii Skay4041 TaxID=703135 RepID=A0A2A9NUF6_9AGAR|nr:hypothetical protein AMATHDRAFT_83673 [Amanita thiersii Skay4041]